MMSTLLTSAFAPIDRVLDRITMYRLTLYALLGLLGVAALLAAFGLLPFSPLALLLSTALLVMMCWATNTLLAWIFAVPTNVESATITALILALILTPASSADGVQLLGWAALLAMASKYVVALTNKHIFNPAAVAVVITAFVLGEPASWWVGTASMLPVVLLGGLLVVRKARQADLVATFLVIAVVTGLCFSLSGGTALTTALRQIVVESPLVFFATIMLTEPLTAPPTRPLKRLYGALVGVLFIPQVHLGALYSTPELALVAGNAFSYLVSPKYNIALALKRKTKVGADIVDFVFTPSRRFAFAPGQYIECTLAHAHPDSRGNRRYFTLASSPTEDAVRLGVRFSPRGSSFKRAMRAMSNREELMGTQIAGDFTLPDDPARKLVFIAGGIGITPFRSMLKYLLDTGQRRDIVLFYANRTADELIYTDVLNEAQQRLGVRIIATLTDAAAIPRDWPGYRGRITAQMIQSATPDFHERLFYLSGPPDMVNASARLLRSLGVAPGQIKQDFFSGLA